MCQVQAALTAQPGSQAEKVQQMTLVANISILRKLKHMEKQSHFSEKRQDQQHTVQHTVVHAVQSR